MQPIERDAAYLWDMSDDFKSNHPEIPRKRILAQRNVLAHEYNDLKQERMWLVAIIHVPALIPQLESVLPSPPPSKE